MPYVISTTYSPTLTPSAGTAVTAGIAGAGPLGYVRVGSGANVPSAGDTVTLYGGILFTGASDGGTIDIPLPFILAAAPMPIPDIVRTIETAAVITALPTSTTNLRLTLVSGASDDGAVIFEFTYQTANAIDP